LYNISKLLEAGAVVRVHDPEAIENVKAILGDKIEYSAAPYSLLEGADALLIATEWPEYRTPDFEKMGKLMKSKLIFDGRNIYDPASMGELGFTYYSIGRETIKN
jgi:UDPglucose 6-dehydrogenase